MSVYEQANALKGDGKRTMAEGRQTDMVGKVVSIMFVWSLSILVVGCATTEQARLNSVNKVGTLTLATEVMLRLQLACAAINERKGEQFVPVYQGLLAISTEKGMSYALLHDEVSLKRERWKWCIGNDRDRWGVFEIRINPQSIRHYESGYECRWREVEGLWHVGIKLKDGLVVDAFVARPNEEAGVTKKLERLGGLSIADFFEEVNKVVIEDSGKPGRDKQIGSEKSREIKGGIGDKQILR